MYHKLKIASVFLFLLQFINLYGQQTIKEEFTLQSPAGFQLSGEIEYPKKKGRFPAAILIWGNGPHTRDQEISRSPMFKQLASHLVSKGMAVLRMDKRGFGKSTGNFSSEGNYTTKDLADDVLLAYTFLNNHKAVDTTRVGLIGHSEGCVIASMIASQIQGVDWMIVLGVPAVAGDAIIAEQTRLNRQQLGMSTEVSDAVGKVWEKYFRFLKSGDNDDSTFYAIGREFLIAHGLSADDKRITPAFIDQLLSAYRTEWNRYFIRTDAGKFYTRINLPLLAVFGSEDRQTSVDQNMMPLYQSLKAPENKRYQIAVLSDEDHFFLRHKGERVEKHRPGEMEVSHRLLNLMSDWLASQGVILPK